ELPLLKRALDKEVLALLVRKRKLGQVVIERQVVPIGVRLALSLVVPVAVRFSESGITDLGSRGQEPHLRSCRQESTKLDPVFLHAAYTPYEFNLLPFCSSSIKPRSSPERPSSG